MQGGEASCEIAHTAPLEVDGVCVAQEVAEPEDLPERLAGGLSQHRLASAGRTGHLRQQAAVPVGAGGHLAVNDPGDLLEGGLEGCVLVIERERGEGHLGARRTSGKRAVSHRRHLGRVPARCGQVEGQSLLDAAQRLDEAVLSRQRS